MTQGFPKMSQCLLKISDDFPRTSERCRKMSEDVPPTFEHFQIKAVEMTILVCFDLLRHKVDHHSTPFWIFWWKIELNFHY